MPDPEPAPGASAAGPPHSYPIPPDAATPSLLARVAARARTTGPLRFHEFMAMALYDPQQGYYAKGTRQVGRGGDFFTSVSVGPLFGQLLARRFANQWHALGQPAPWRITECGAHDGTLARDILDHLAALDPAAHAAVEYAIAEPLGRLRDAQRATLADHAGRLHHVNHPDELVPRPGVVFGNELLDALPFDVVEFHHGQWYECRVAAADDGALCWQRCAASDPALVAALSALGHAFADGYRTELRTELATFLGPLRRSLTRGSMLWFDYGFARDDYYHPDRRAGTLRTFSHHRAGDDPLAAPGDTDITAHVDFTTVADVLTALGATTSPLQSQGSWLTNVAREWLLQQEGRPDAALLRQFQTLTHPGHLGRSFHVLEAIVDEG